MQQPADIVESAATGGAASPASARGWGIAMVLAAALFASLAGLFVRQIDAADGWTLLFYRSVAFTLTVLLFMAIRGRAHPRAFLAIGWPGLIVAVILGGAFLAYIFALRLTTVANAVFILSASPFLAALLARALLAEPISRVMWICMALCMAGVAIMVADGLATGMLLGSLVAILAVLGYSGALVAYRVGKARDMMPATCLAGVVAVAASATLAPTFAISGHDLMFAVLLGTVQLGGQYILITLASRHVQAGEVSLLMMLEIIAAPFWVWLAFGEEPGKLALVGGPLIALAVFIQGFVSLKRARAARRRVAV